MKPIHTLQSILSDFDEKFGKKYGAGLCDCADYMPDNVTDEVSNFLKQSIKDALEACRVEKVKIGKEFNEYAKGYWEAHNDAATQYDENVRNFMGEEVK